MKKFFYLILGLFFVFIQSVFAQLQDSFPYDNGYAPDSSDVGAVTKQEVTSNGSVLKGLTDMMGLSTTSTEAGSDYIKTVINYFLGIVSLIALAVLIYGFYLVFFSESSEEGLKKAWKYIKLASVALFVMGVSWFIVSWFFDVFNQVKQ